MNQSEQQNIDIVYRWGFKPIELERITSGNTYTQLYLLSDPASTRLFCFRGNKGNEHFEQVIFTEDFEIAAERHCPLNCHVAFDIYHF